MGMHVSLTEASRLLAASLASLLLVACGDSNSGSQQGNQQAQSTEPVEQTLAAPGYRRINEANPNDPLNAHIFELDNGLKVYLTENHEEPRFYAEIAGEDVDIKSIKELRPPVVASKRPVDVFFAGERVVICSSETCISIFSASKSLTKSNK